MLIATLGDVYQIQPGLSPWPWYTEARFLPRESPFSFPHSLSISLFLSLALNRNSPFAKPLNIQTSSSSERAINTNSTGRASPFLYAENKRTLIPRSSARMPRKFRIIGPIRSSNSQCQVSGDQYAAV